ncbi:hypothetical protein [Streptomyces sp. NPDC101178]|uniref:hypothetical protein n=1 Tax=Streptomyces sp. NPDC101178 TaxID=3366124 RepID=UPI0038180137
MPSTISGLPLSGPEAPTVFGAITVVLARRLPHRFGGPAALAPTVLRRTGRTRYDVDRHRRLRWVRQRPAIRLLLAES